MSSQTTDISIVVEIKGKIADLIDQLNRIQSQCPHPADAMHYVSGRCDGEGTDSRWFRNFHCRLCDKRWTEDV